MLSLKYVIKYRNCSHNWNWKTFRNMKLKLNLTGIIRALRKQRNGNKVY